MARPPGIEAVIAARRGGVPTKEELQHRTATISARRESQPPASTVARRMQESVLPQLSNMSLEELRKHCDELLEQPPERAKVSESTRSEDPSVQHTRPHGRVDAGCDPMPSADAGYDPMPTADAACDPIPSPVDGY